MAKDIEKVPKIEIDARRQIADALLKNAKLPIMFITGSPIYCGNLDFDNYKKYFPNSKSAHLVYFLLREHKIDKGLPSIIAEICLEEEKLEQEVKTENYTSAAEIRNNLEGLYAQLGTEATEKSQFLKRAREKNTKHLSN